MNDKDVDLWRKERNKALRTLDIEYARNQSPKISSSDEVLLIALHQARYECTDIEKKLRLESGEWLRERGFKAMYGLSILPPGELPK